MPIKKMKICSSLLDGVSVLRPSQRNSPQPQTSFASLDAIVIPKYLLISLNKRIESHVRSALGYFSRHRSEGKGDQMRTHSSVPRSSVIPNFYRRSICAFTNRHGKTPHALPPHTIRHLQLNATPNGVRHDPASSSRDFRRKAEGKGYENVTLTLTTI